MSDKKVSEITQILNDWNDGEDAAKERGEQFMAGLKALQKKHPVIGEVRGKGLFIAMEIVADEARTPDAKLAKALSNEALNQSLIISATGAHGNNLRITPPLVITASQVERSLAALATVFARVVPASQAA